MKKLGVLYVCTGKYDVFWDGFFESCEKYLTGIEKKYFVFTDSERILKIKDSRIVTIYQEHLGWPGSTLFRYQMFNKHTDLYDVDYLYFFNANFVFVDNVGEELLPDGNEIVCVRHPGYYNKNNLQFPYSRDIRSKAFIPFFFGKVYVMGGLNGGTKASFLSMSKELDNRISDDYKRNVIAIWHDESQINRYVYENGCKLLNPSYGYPEGWDIPFEKKILLRDKAKWIDVNGIKKV